MEDLSGDNLILTCKIIYKAQFQLLKKIMSDSGGNFISNSKHSAEA